MAKRSRALFIGLTLLALGGAGLYAASRGADGPEPDEGSETAGMVLSEDCLTLTVVGVEAALDAILEHAEATNAIAWLDANEPGDFEQFMVEFLAHHFPGCFPPEPGPEFRWVTTFPKTEERTWAEVIADMRSAAQGAPLLPGMDAAPQLSPAEAVARVVATSTPPPTVVVDPAPQPSPDTPEHEYPLPPKPQPLPPKDAAPWDMPPANVLEATTAAHLIDAGVERAMEPAGQLSPQPRAVFVVYDPAYAELPALLADLDAWAQEAPDVLFVAASMADTQAAFGKPEQLGVLGFAVNAANPMGQYLYSEHPFLRDPTQPPLTSDEWATLLEHAIGPV